MRVHATVDIEAPKEAVWRVVTDIEHAAGRIQGIQKVEVLERPKDGLVGLKWRETRTMFGKTATEVMWVTDAASLEHYVTRAQSHGAVYTSRIRLQGQGNGTRLSMEFEGQPLSVGAKLIWGPTGFMFKGATRKALQKDLQDIKQAVEGQR